MKEKFSKLIRGQVPIAVIFIVLGMCLIGMPASTLNILYKVVFGLALIGSGAYHLYIYIKKKTGASILDMFSGVTTVILGIFLFSNPQIVIRLLPFTLAGFVVADIAWVIKEILKLRKGDGGFWQLMVMVSLIMLILAIVLAFDPFRTVRTMLTYAGWVLLLKGITDLLIILFTSNNKLAKAAANKAETFAVVPTKKPKREPRRLGILRPKKDKEEKKEEGAAAHTAADVNIDDMPIVDAVVSDSSAEHTSYDASYDDDIMEEGFAAATEQQEGHGDHQDDQKDADSYVEDVYVDDIQYAQDAEDSYDDSYDDSYLDDFDENADDADDPEGWKQ